MALQVDTSTLDQFPPGEEIGGCVWFVAGAPFPEKDWYDYPLVLVAWWLQVLLRLASGETTHDEVCFMDGPFVVRVRLNAAQRLELEFIERGLTETTVCGTATVDLITTIQSAVEVAQRIATACDARGFKSRDLVLLRSAIRKAAVS